MPWPLSQDYNEAVQNPTSCFNDPELRQAEARCNAIGLPMPCSGNFADVYEMIGPGVQKWAVKCFTRQVAGLRERYAAISAYLKQANLKFMVDFTYLDQGINVKGQWYPILKMDWVEGFTLNEFVKQHADNPSVLEVLCRIWVRLGRRLRAVQLAHGDLQHGNVLLVPGKQAGALSVKLIDYDGMFVPALATQPSGEVGHPAYQHPQRIRQGLYSAEVDRFPNLVIITALRALMVGGRYLWNKYDNGDNLLFRQADLEAASRSPLFEELLKWNDINVRQLTAALLRAAQQPVEQTPLPDELAADSDPTRETRESSTATDAPRTPAVFAQLGGGDVIGPRRSQAARSRVGVMIGAVASVALVVGGLLLALNRKSADSGIAVVHPSSRRSQPSQPASTRPSDPMEGQPGRVVGEWQNQAGTTLSLQPDGTIRGQTGVWFLQNQRLILFRPSDEAPGGAWMDVCTLAKDGRSYQGHDVQGTPVHGQKLKESPQGKRPLPSGVAPDLVGAWQLSKAGDDRRITLAGDGTISTGSGSAAGLWFIRDSMLLLLWPADLPAAGWAAEMLELSVDRSSASGKSLATDQSVTLHSLKLAVDLLKLIDSQKNSIQGSWRFDRSTLVSPAVPHGRIQVPFTPPDEYDLELEVTRAQGDEALVVGLVVGGKPCAMTVDSPSGNTWKSGMELVDGRLVAANETHWSGKLLTNGKPVKIACSVRRSYVAVLAGNVPVIYWSGDRDRLATPRAWAAPNPGQLLLGSNGSYRILKLMCWPRSSHDPQQQLRDWLNAFGGDYHITSSNKANWAARFAPDRKYSVITVTRNKKTRKTRTHVDEKGRWSQVGEFIVIDFSDKAQGRVFLRFNGAQVLIGTQDSPKGKEQWLAKRVR